MINVTKTFLPPQEEYNELLISVWESGWLTNRGVLVQELEKKIKNRLQVNSIIATTNGTLPIQIAIKALNLSGEIITSPFSYVATTSSIVWENCKPVFVDIHPEYLTIDELKIEEAITDSTTAILATHVFGNPCDVKAIEKIAKKHDLKVIYDAAHCFGVTYNGQSVFNFGDISTCSFHATKIFHTGEGGAIFANDNTIVQTLFYHHNFGHYGNEVFHGLGINAKMSELQAAMGLAVFPYIDTIINSRKIVNDNYNKGLKDIDIQLFRIRENTIWNYSYYPVIFKSEFQMFKVKKALEDNDIYPRRYFFPSLDNLPYVNSVKCKNSNSVAERILCLPTYVGLESSEQDQIIKIIRDNVC